MPANNHKSVGVYVLELVTSGGWLMLPIILCSILAVAICVERIIALNPQKIAPSNLLGQVWGWLKNNQLDATKKNKSLELKERAFKRIT